MVGGSSIEFRWISWGRSSSNLFPTVRANVGFCRPHPLIKVSLWIIRETARRKGTKYDDQEQVRQPTDDLGFRGHCRASRPTIGLGGFFAQRVFAQQILAQRGFAQRGFAQQVFAQRVFAQRVFA